MREVVTIQLGQQANYVGSHYWNAQESYFTYAGEAESPVHPDVSFRPGRGPDGTETFTPRTLIYDLKGAFGTLRRENALYAQEFQLASHSQWTGNIASIQLPPIAPSPYQQALDAGLQPPVLTPEAVRFWSDYNRVYYHPKSLVQLSEYEVHSTLLPFENWATGGDLFATLDREHDLLDRDLRPFLEDCDQLQGLQLLTGLDDAWGGFAARYLERIADDLGKGCRWVFGLQDTRRTSRARQMMQTANVAQSLVALDQSATALTPLANFPVPPLSGAVALDPASPWHTAALQATAIETLTLPTRLRPSHSGHAVLNTLESVLNNDGRRRIAACTFSVADPAALSQAPESAGHHDSRMNHGDSTPTPSAAPPDQIDLFPCVPFPSTLGRRSRRPHTFSEISVHRGAWTGSDAVASINAAARDPFQSNGPHAAIYATPQLFPLLSSFPSIYALAALNPAIRNRNLAVRARVVTSSAIATTVREIEGWARRLVAVEEREALCDGLALMAEEYEEGWGSDDDDEDE